MEKAKIIAKRDGGKNEEFKVVINPSDYNLQFQPKYAKHNILNGNSQITNFVGGDNSKLTVTLYVDGYIMSGNDFKPEDVNTVVKKLVGLTRIDPKLHRPPVCTFVWGSLSFEGVVESASVKYTMFESNGKPVRATVDMTFSDTEDAKIPFESPDRTKRRVLTQDTQLFMLSYECYNNCEMWRNIADANNIKNPRELQIGQAVRIPAII